MNPNHECAMDQATLSHLRVAGRELLLLIRTDRTDVLVNQPEPAPPDAARNGILEQWAAALQDDGWEINCARTASIGLQRPLPPITRIDDATRRPRPM